MAEETRIIRLTAARTYIGQVTIEVPSWCRNERLLAIVANGGATTRYLGPTMQFGGIIGTGLATPIISDLNGSQAAEIRLADIAVHLRQDGLIF